MGEDQNPDDSHYTPPPKSAELISETGEQDKTGNADTKSGKPKIHHRSVRQRWATMSLPNKLMAVATIFIAIATVVNVCIAYAQWNEMDESGTQTSRLIHLYRWQLARLSQQASDTHDLADRALSQATATNDLAKQTKRGADIADRNRNSTIEQFQLDQRAWIGLADPQIIDQPATSNNPPKFEFAFVNSGKTPAKDVNVAIDWNPQGFLLLPPVCAEFKANPDKGFFPSPYIPPQGKYIVRDPPSNPRYLEDTRYNRWTKPGPYGDYFCIVGEITYTDVKNMPHFTHFCVYAKFESVKDVKFCPGYNDLN